MNMRTGVRELDIDGPGFFGFPIQGFETIGSHLKIGCQNISLQIKVRLEPKGGMHDFFCHHRMTLFDKSGKENHLFCVQQNALFMG